MALLTVGEIDRDGFDPVGGAVACEAGGDSVPNDNGDVFVRVANGDASQHTVTIVTQKTVDGQAVADRTVDIPAGEERLIGPFPPGTYNDTNQRTQFTYDAVASMTIAAVKLGS